MVYLEIWFRIMDTHQRSKTKVECPRTTVLHKKEMHTLKTRDPVEMLWRGGLQE